ncbi:hypothetical protein Tdes44962_MAKER04965 [Teratosphaeria destructans]|uniref:Secreted protein n=1 Tax=Teratosphaeria destructans TaxID=418781 RepID=A0A9W7SLN5_9PEZI|nr:hypothetical protein Tdes44962_MAKER04965 [Teratosphaeria destructans]
MLLPVLVVSASKLVGLLIVVAEPHAHPGRIDAPVSDQQEDGEERLGAEVQDAVEDCLAVRCDHVAAFADAPGDGVQQPDHEREDTAQHVHAMDVAA